MLHAYRAMSRQTNSQTKNLDRLNGNDLRLSDAKIWKMLHNPKYTQTGPNGRLIYTHHVREDFEKDVNLFIF